MSKMQDRERCSCARDRRHDAGGGGAELLVDRGADLHEKTPEGLTALDFARRLGHTAVVDALVKAGATSEA